MSRVSSPEAMNEAFADGFNSRQKEGVSALYETDAVLQSDVEGTAAVGLDAIRVALTALLEEPGIVARGSSAELVRQQGDGS